MHVFGMLLQSRVFGVAPLSAMDWVYVVLWSFPIIILDEFLKLLGELLTAWRAQLLPLHRPAFCQFHLDSVAPLISHAFWSFKMCSQLVL